MTVYVFYTCRSRSLSYTEGYGVNFSARKIKYEIKLHKISLSENIVHEFLSMEYNNLFFFFVWYSMKKQFREGS